jgi:hypothetical protein
MRGNWLAWDQPSTRVEAKHCFERATELDPGYGLPSLHIALERLSATNIGVHIIRGGDRQRRKPADPDASTHTSVWSFYTKGRIARSADASKGPTPEYYPKSIGRLPE